MISLGYFFNEPIQTSAATDLLNHISSDKQIYSKRLQKDLGVNTIDKSKEKIKFPNQVEFKIYKNRPFPDKEVSFFNQHVQSANIIDSNQITSFERIQKKH